VLTIEGPPVSQTTGPGPAQDAVGYDGAYVPVIDIAPYFTGEAHTKQKVADAIGAACREIGFYIIVGHGVAPALVDRVDHAARAFFDLPFDE
jgi:isopenicillin N synthase-like dioxygenase